MHPHADPQRAFPQRLRAARELRGLSQLELAVRAQLQQAAVSLYESGARRPSLRNLGKLAETLEVTTDYLLGRSVDSAAVAPPHEPLLQDFASLTTADRQLARRLVAELAHRPKAS